MKNLVAAFFLLLLLETAAALDLSVGPGDLRIEQRGDGGYQLFIRVKPGMGSVLLTETTKDPAMKADNFSYRAKTWNPINGDEKRMLDGAFIPSEKKIYSLIDSTPESDAQFGSAFRIFIPYVIEFGYAWSRSGEIFLSDGTFINIRIFEKPYSDYSGAFADNPYLVRVTQAPLPRPPAVVPPAKPPVVVPAKPEPDKEVDTSLFMKDTVDSFSRVAESGKGIILFSTGEADITGKLGIILDRAKGKSVDLVICLDTTDSMKDDIDAVKHAIPDMIKKRISDFKSLRLGVVLYKDYFEDYVTRRYDFTLDVEAFTQWVTAVRVAGGRDIPEAVYEALYDGLVGYPWIAEKKIIVLIGDAPPHPIPRGKINSDMVEAEALRRGIELDVIILPH